MDELRTSHCALEPAAAQTDGSAKQLGLRPVSRSDDGAILFPLSVPMTHGEAFVLIRSQTSLVISCAAMSRSYSRFFRLHPVPFNYSHSFAVRFPILVI